MNLFRRHQASLEEICLLSNSEAKNFMSVVEYKKCFRFFHPKSHLLSKFQNDILKNMNV